MYNCQNRSVSQTHEQIAGMYKQQIKKIIITNIITISFIAIIIIVILIFINTQEHEQLEQELEGQRRRR